MVGTTKGSRQYLKGLSVDEAYAALAEEMSPTFPVGTTELKAFVSCSYELGCKGGAVVSLKMDVRDDGAIPDRFKDNEHFRKALEASIERVLAETKPADPIPYVAAIALPGRQWDAEREIVAFSYEELLVLAFRVQRMIEVMNTARARAGVGLLEVGEDDRLEEAATKEPPSSRLVMGGGINTSGLG